MRTLLVIGADAAGMSAAAQARRLSGPDELRIVAVDRGHYSSYSACGIPYWLAGDVADPDALIARSPEVHREQYAIDLRLRTEATELDLDSGHVSVRQIDDGRVERIGFDEVMIATGARPKRPPIDGLDAHGVYGVQTLDDGAAVQRALGDGPRRAVVVGAGYIGLEMAEALVRRGVDVTVVHPGDWPMPNLDPELGQIIGERLRGIGVTVHNRTRIDGVVTEAGRARAVSTGVGELPADLVVLGTGVEPDSSLARAAGVELGVRGGVRVDPRQRSRSHEQVWAAGDCVESIHRVTRQPVVVALATHANKQGRVAGTNIGGGYATFPGVIGTAVTKLCDLEIGRTGLSTAEARAAGFEVIAVTTRSSSRVGYFPGAEPITVRVVAERRSGRLLGAQIVGDDMAAKRIDAFAVAVWNGMTAQELAMADLSYAPPFSPVLDPVVIAARRAFEAVDADVRSCG